MAVVTFKSRYLRLDCDGETRTGNETEGMKERRMVSEGERDGDGKREREA